jgi:hypothetical protein
MAEEWLEYDCPDSCVDMEVFEPLPYPEDEFTCPCCGNRHRYADLSLSAMRQDSTGAVTYITEEWRQRRMDA